MSNKQLLDPLGSLCKLVALNFCKVKTKISIHDHILSLHTPNTYQWMLRYYNGDTKENISGLYHVVIRVINWYLVTDLKAFQESDDTDNWSVLHQCNEMKKIIRYVCSALRRLQETYEYGNATLAIQFYINLLEDALDNRFTDNKLPRYILEKESEYKNLINYDILRNFWDINKLRRIVELYDKCFAIYSPSSETNELVDKYLNTIYSLLEISDNEFQMLIQNSNKG